MGTTNILDMNNRLNGNESAIDALDDELDAVKERFDYSSDEHVVGKWIDGKDIYEKVINFGGLPNASSKAVAHGIVNLGRVVELKGTAHNIFMGVFINILTPGNNFIIPSVDSSNLIIVTGGDRSAYDECYVILRYTKSS